MSEISENRTKKVIDSDQIWKISMKYADTLLQITSSAANTLIHLNEKEMSHKPIASKWSKKEILGHLIDSAYNNHQRFLRAEEQSNLTFDGYDQVDWVIRNQYQQRKSSEIIHTWIIVNQHLSHLITSLSPEIVNRTTTKHNLDKIGMRPVEHGAPISLGFLIEDYIFHIEHHLAQLIPDYDRVIV